MATFAIAASLRAQSPDVSPKPDAAAPSPNEALAMLARETLMKSLPPQYEKRDNWGHQKQTVVGYDWVFRDGDWHLDKRTKPLNDGLWRMYRVRLVNPDRNLSLRVTPPQPAENGATTLHVFLTARLHAEAWQEQWRMGIKGFNFYLEAETTVEVRLDVNLAIQAAPDASFGTIEVHPHVNDVGLRLVDLKVQRIDKIGGDVARELGRALKDVVADELHKREPELAKKINSEIEKHRNQLRFTASQIVDLGWDKIQGLLASH